MAKGKFFVMKMDCPLNSLVRALYNLPDNQLAALIFQYEIRDTVNKREEYTLVAYGVDKTGAVIIYAGNPAKITLTLDANNPYPPVKSKLFFGNLPYSKDQLGYFIGNDPTGAVKYLSFKPFAYNEGTGEYVAYNVEASFGVKLLGGDDLKPSPPAIPPSLLPAKRKK